MFRKITEIGAAHMYIVHVVLDLPFHDKEHCKGCPIYAQF